MTHLWVALVVAMTLPVKAHAPALLHLSTHTPVVQDPPLHMNPCAVQLLRSVQISPQTMRVTEKGSWLSFVVKLTPTDLDCTQAIGGLVRYMTIADRRDATW